MHSFEIILMQSFATSSWFCILDQAKEGFAMNQNSSGRKWSWCHDQDGPSDDGGRGDLNGNDVDDEVDEYGWVCNTGAALAN